MQDLTNGIKPKLEFEELLLLIELDNIKNEKEYKRLDKERKFRARIDALVEEIEVRKETKKC